jgi:hypothetical protein
MSWGFWHWFLIWLDLSLLFILWFHAALGPPDDGDDEK